jgi:hypothetical protein
MSASEHSRRRQPKTRFDPRPHGLPPFMVEALLGLFAAAAAGEYVAVSADAARLAGRPIEAVSAFVAHSAAQ